MPDPTAADTIRALALTEAAEFLRDAHFRDGMSVQEIGTAIRNTADLADPRVGSYSRDGFGLDEIAALVAEPAAVPPVPADTDLPAPADRADCPDPIECSHEAALGQARQDVHRLGLMVDEYGDGASALTRKLKQVRDLHRETCPLVQGQLNPTAFTCGMCELLDAPAADLRRMADEAQQTEAEQQAGEGR